MVDSTSKMDFTPPASPAGTSNETLQFINCRLIRSGKIVVDDLWVRNGLILNPEPVFYEEQIKADVVIDCKNAVISAGFIDLQINGGFGYDFSSDLDKLDIALDKVRKGLLASGVTSFCPTIVTSPPPVYHEVISRVNRRPGDVDGAGILGLHLEGPFINPERKGAHPLQFIQGFDKGITSLKSTYGKLDNVSIITIAPELPGACEIIKEITTHDGVVVSVGHSNGNLDHGEAAMNNGASFITHLFNAMLPFHHRDPGLVGLLTSRFVNKQVFYGIIADGIHTHPAALRIAQLTNPKGLVLVTDAMAAMGLGEGQHSLGQLVVEVRNRRAFLPGTNTLAGSIVTMDDCIRRFIKATDVDVVEAVEAATLHPAQTIGIESTKGTLEFNSDADFVFLDDSGPLKVLNTFIGGQCVFTAPDAPVIEYKPLKV